MKKTIFIMIPIVLGFIMIVNAGEFKVKPEDYRNWSHVKSMVIFDQKHPLYNPFNGIHHVYVNKKGLDTIKKSGHRKFANGTVIAIVFYEHIPDNGAYVEGKKRLEAFMIKNSKKYASTEGWGYYAYDGDGKNIVNDMSKDCHSCHSQVRDSDFVFSIWTK